MVVDHTPATKNMRVWKFGDDIDTDAIIPGRFLIINNPDELAKHAFEGTRDEFAKKVKEGDVIVGGRNFGCGSSREHAPLALIGAGVKVVVAQSFARIFFRNSINVGLLPVVCPDADKIADGSKVTLNIREGYLEADGNKYPIEPVPVFMQGIIDAGRPRGICKEREGDTSMYKIASIGGDGIGPEIVAEGKKVLEAAAETYNFDIQWTDFDIGADRYINSGKLVTEDELKELAKFRAIYFGAIGDERVKPGILEKGILLALRFHFDMYVNLRPIKLLNGVETPLAGKGPKDIDFVVVRENTEDFYVGIGSRFKKHEKKELNVIRDIYSVKFGLDVESDAEEIAYQIGVITREGSRRVQTYAFDLAMQRKKKLTSVDKANVLSDVYGLWRDVFTETAKVLSRCQDGLQFRGRSHHVVCQEPRMVRRGRDTQHVRRHHH